MATWSAPLAALEYEDMMPDEKTTLHAIVCISAKEPLKPGNVRDLFCCTCNEEVQVGPLGMEALGKGGRLYCYPCGNALMEATGQKNIPMSAQFGPRATAAILEHMAKKAGLSDEEQ